MAQTIAETAGEVRRTLSENQEVRMSDLPEMLDVSAPVAYEALGWLSGEGMLRYKKREGATFVSLNDVRWHASQAPAVEDRCLGAGGGRPRRPALPTKPVDLS